MLGLKLSSGFRTNLVIKGSFSRSLKSHIRTSHSAPQPTAIDFKKIETKWLERWKSKPPEGSGTLGKYYVLAMFPYPSGNLHMGHVRVYTISDTLARFRRMLGHEVIHPMGWDAFGLPAENAAMERDISPETWTRSNVATMKQQLQQLHLSIDWDREINTSEPEYYRWTQYLMLLLFKRGLLYRKQGEVNWDPVDKTVLANEQVDAQGRSWRSGALVERRSLTQWYMRITDYAESLLNDLEGLSGWPERVKGMQTNWIGKSQGFTFTFPLAGGDGVVQAFTSRPETVVGATYLAVSKDHQILKHVPPQRASEVQSFVSKKQMEKHSGVDTGLLAINPITGAKVVIYVADYVLADYGTGAVMGVPAHDARDYGFAMQRHELRNFPRIVDDPSGSVELPYTGKGNMSASLQHEWVGLSSTAAAEAIVNFATRRNLGHPVTQYRLRDWLISRQRYWGAPMPFIHCKRCGVVPVPVEELPVRLPPAHTIKLTGHEGSPLASVDDFVQTTCPKCSGNAKRDTDTMDTFVDSSWYYLRFLDNRNLTSPISTEKMAGMPVDLYVGGVEHAILHLLYARFVSKVLGEEFPNLAFSKQKAEPFKRLLTQGMVQGRTFRSTTTAQSIRPEDVDLKNPETPLHKVTGEPLTVTYEKMSKSKYNGIDPKATTDKFGVDATRLYVLFKAPPEDSLEWDDQSVVGMQRFLAKIHKLASQHTPNLAPVNPNEMCERQRSLYRFIHHTIRHVTCALETDFKLNGAVSHLIKLLNRLTDDIHLAPYPVYHHGLATLIQLLSPMAPTSSEEFWELIHPSSPQSVLNQQWPKVNPHALNQDSVVCVVQVNGKRRLNITLDKSNFPQNPHALPDFVKAAVLSEPTAAKYLPVHDTSLIKRVFVLDSGKLVNFVVASKSPKKVV